MKLYLVACLLLISSFSSCNSSENTPTQSSREREEIEFVMQKVTDWQIRNFTYSLNGNLHDYGIDAWTNGVLYLGMQQWAQTINNDSIYRWLYDLGDKNEWKIPSNFKNYPKYQLYHADELCIGQFYLNMYGKYSESKMLDSTKVRVDWILANQPDPDMTYKNKQSWTWCDALFMAPPVYAKMAEITGNSNYLTYMDTQFKRTYEHLYNKEEKLFYRDDSYFGKTEANGTDVFWGRGNGWVIAGVANLLKILPQESELRPFYESLFKEMAVRLIELQSEDGFWHASLLDPDSYPSPEASATALITYSLAYGINSGLLSEKECMPAMQKGWNSLLSAVNEEGKLGWVQPIGADPKKVTSDMTAVYGVGAFLLAGSEIYNMINK